MSLNKAILTQVLIIFVLLLNSPVSVGDSFNIIYITNHPDIEKSKETGGFPELATYLKSARKSNPNTLVLHGGGLLGPSMLSSFDRGSHMIMILNELGIDGMAVSEREFSFYEDELVLRTSEADFPMLSANIFDPLNKGNLDGIISSYIFDIGRHSVGVTALISKEVITKYLPKRILVTNADTALRKITAELREQGAEIVILLLDYEDPGLDIWLEEAVVDLAFSNSGSKGDQFELKNGRLKIIRGTNFGSVINVKVSPSDHLKTGDSFDWSQIDLSNYQPDQQIKQLMSEFSSVLTNLIDKKIGTFGTQIKTYRKNVRSQESAFGNLVCDALKETYQADISLFNGGSIRGNRQYDVGETITRKTILKELPFRNTVAILNVTGEQILQALENGFSKIEDKSGRFPQVSGMQIEVSVNSPIGHRVKSVKVAGKVLNRQSHYRLVTSAFLADGGDGYDSFKLAERLYETVGEQIIADIISKYVSTIETVTPHVEGRIKMINN